MRVRRRAPATRYRRAPASSPSSSRIIPAWNRNSALRVPSARARSSSIDAASRVPAVRVQRPRVGVGDVDALPARPLVASRGERARGIAVVGVEQRELQVHVHAVGRRTSRLHRVARRRTAGRPGRAAPSPVQVAERDHVLGGGVARDDVGVAGDRELVHRRAPTRPWRARPAFGTYDGSRSSPRRYARRAVDRHAGLKNASSPSWYAAQARVRGRPGRVERHPHRALGAGGRRPTSSRA